MALAFTQIESSTGTSGTSQATGSVAFANNVLYLCSFCTAGAGSVGTGVTGGGITWSLVRGTGNQTNESAQVYCGFVTSGASTGALTIASTGTVSRVTWNICSVTGSSATSGGTNAMVQSAFQTRTSAQTSSSVTLSAFADATNNAVFQFVHVKASTITVNPEGGYSNLSSYAGVGISLGVSYLIGQDTSVTSSWTGSATIQAVAAEIAMASAAPSVHGLAALGVGG